MENNLKKYSFELVPGKNVKKSLKECKGFSRS